MALAGQLVLAVRRATARPPLEAVNQVFHERGVEQGRLELHVTPSTDGVTASDTLRMTAVVAERNS